MYDLNITITTQADPDNADGGTVVASHTLELGDWYIARQNASPDPASDQDQAQQE
jgi:hypothetical protein